MGGSGCGVAEVGRIEPTGRGSPVPLVLKTRRAPDPVHLHSIIMATSCADARGPPIQCRDASRPRGHREDVCVLLLFLVALGPAVARKVRSS